MSAAANGSNGATLLAETSIGMTVAENAVENNLFSQVKNATKQCLKNASCRSIMEQMGMGALVEISKDKENEAISVLMSRDIEKIKNLSPEQIAFLSLQISSGKGLLTGKDLELLYKYSPYLHTTIALDPNEHYQLEGYPAKDPEPLILITPQHEEDGRNGILSTPIPEENRVIIIGGGYQPINPELFPSYLTAQNLNYGQPFELKGFEGATPESLERFKRYLEDSIDTTTGTGKKNATKPNSVSRLDDWNKLTSGAKITDYPGNRKVAEFPDGTRAVYRPSKTGPKTIELQRATNNKTIVEVRYEKE